MFGVAEDLRYGFRALARNKILSLVAILSLALGLGANTTIFTLVRAVLLRPIPVRDPSTLAAVHTVDSGTAGLLYSSLPNYRDLRDRNRAFSSLLIYTIVTVNVTGQGDPRLLIGQLVSANYFSTLGVSPVLGRGFLPEEEAAGGAAPVAIISHPAWLRMFGGDPKVTARTITLNGRAYQIVGVAPKSFFGLNTLYAADVWLPLSTYPQIYPNPAMVDQRRALLFSVVGRLNPGTSLVQAAGSLLPIAEELEHEFPVENRGRRFQLTAVADAALNAKTRNSAARAGLVLMIVSGLVLLIACANVANLLLARAAGRNKEMSVRLALGANRWRLVRQLLTESLALSFLGGLAGLLFARWGRDAVWALRPPMFNHAGFEVALDGQVFGYAFLAATLSAILFGILPALRATRSDLATDLKERMGTAPSGRRSVYRSFLVASQIAFSVVALIGAGLFVRSILNAAQIDVGFDAAHLGIVGFNVGDQGYTEARGREYQSRALAAARETPGVISATIAKDAPFHVSNSRTVIVDGQEKVPTLTTAVHPGYFQTVGTALLRGRDFSEHDRPATPLVAIVNESAAAQFWPGQNPVGKALSFFGDSRVVQVIGVARNASYQGIAEPAKGFIYLSLVQYYFPAAIVYVRTSGNPALVAAAVKRRLQPLDHNFLLQAESVDEVMLESLWAQRLSALLLTVFGGLALVLATIGIFGVISYSVAQRSREFGVRMALGATAADVQRMVVAESLWMVGAGLVAGLALALLSSHAVGGMLFAVGPRDAVTFVAVPAILAAVSVLACWVPAYFATRVEPCIALRDE
jgi:predicted permease